MSRSSFLLASLLLALAPLFAIGAARGEDKPPPPAPRYEALRFGKVRMHAGPGRQYPVLWVYQRKGLPVEVQASYDVWRRVADPDGTVGWVEDTMLSDKRTVLVTKTRRTLRQDPADTSAAVALADPGTVAHVTLCETGWCKLKFDSYDGWLKETELWGTAPNETFGAP